jgi:hypothetical protein
MAQPHLFFFGSLLGTFAVLYFGSRYLADLLDIRIANLILIGLPKEDDPMSSYTLQDVIPLASSPAFIASAALVVASIVYFMFGGRTSLFTRQ